MTRLDWVVSGVGFILALALDNNSRLRDIQMTLETKTFTPGQTIESPAKTKYRLSELDIEAYLIRQVEKAGGKAYKWQSQTHRSVHDRICIFPPGEVWLVEVKAPDGKKSPGQKTFHHKLFHDVGFRQSITVWCKEDVEEFLTLRRFMITGRRLNREQELLLRQLQISRIKRS